MEWTPRCYDDLVPLLDGVLAELEAEPFRLAAREIREALSGDAPADEAEAACRLLAKTGTAPPWLLDPIRWQVACRVRGCLYYCHDMAGMSCYGRTAGEVVLSLLTDYWQDVGRYHWILEDLLGGDFEEED